MTHSEQPADTSRPSGDPVDWLYRLFAHPWLAWIPEKWVRFFRFCFVGGSTFVVFYSLVFILVALLEMPVMLATALAYVVSVIMNYWMHHAFTFERETTHGYSVPRYLTVIVLGFSFNQLVMYLGVEVAGIHYLIVQLCSMAVIITSNYLAYTFWAFASSRS